MLARFVLLISTVFLFSSGAWAQSTQPLTIVAKIWLGSSGRIDHMSVDRQRHRLFVAELGNNSIAVVDLDARKLAKRITSVKEPQGVLYVPGADTLFVASGDDGSVHAFKGDELVPAGQLDFRDDADNLRLDPDGKRVWVGYGSGALATFDAASLQKVGEIRLKGHPESFQIQKSGPRIYVNVPGAREVAVVDRMLGKQVASWNPEAISNFPMTLIDDSVAVVSRIPARLIVFDAAGKSVSRQSTCGDSDDLFNDSKRQRLYVSCGSGVIEIYDLSKSAPVLMSRIDTSSGARTSFFDADADRLYLAVRAQGSSPAEIWVYQPN